MRPVDGKSAFPNFEVFERYDEDRGRYVETHAPVGGMTLRDYFAGQVLAGGILECFAAGDAWTGYDDLAGSCYAMADAMLKAREAQ